MVPAFRDAPWVLTYVASKDHEVETKGVIERLLSEGRRVAVPVMTGRENLAWVRLRSLDPLKPGRFGILEPELQEETTDWDSSAVCLVPGIAFNLEGHRVGYGRGYFDRFLARFTGLALGLAYELQLTATLEPEPHDRPMDAIITERRVISIRPGLLTSIDGGRRPS